MSGMSLPVSRPLGRALIVGAPPTRAQPVSTLRALGYDCTEADDPYAAAQELFCNGNSYDSLILALASLYREELALVATVKRRYPHVEIWLCHTDGRQAALAEAMRMGADGLLADDGLHRVAVSSAANRPRAMHEPSTDERPPTASLHEALMRQADEPPQAENGDAEAVTEEAATDGRQSAWSSSGAEPLPGEPVLTAEELRALLMDQPMMPPSGSKD